MSTIKVNILSELENIENEAMLKKIYELVHLLNGYPEYVRMEACTK